MIEHALYRLVVGLCGGRIYYVTAPQDVAAPYLVITKVAADRHHSHNGSSNLARVRVQFAIFADTYLEAKELAQAIQTILDGYRGISEGIEIQATFYDQEVDMFEIFGASIGRFYQVVCDYVVWHTD